jgi:ABC-type branched-subunit amino acid transport system substrate-binding protein
MRGLFLLCIVLFILTACAVSRTPPVIRIALLAPFEGRYREIGYEMLYAARLALREGGYSGVELLPLDTGENAESAVQRAQALAANPLVRIVIAAGYEPSSARVQSVLGDVPLLIVGGWDAQPIRSGVFQLSNREIPARITTPAQIEITAAAEMPAPLIGGEVLALRGFAKLRADMSMSDVTVLSSAILPDADFTQRYLESDLFVPSPGLLATLTYDAAHIAAQAALTSSRTAALTALETTDYQGLNGSIRFDSDGYWDTAPIHRYAYDSAGQLVLVPGEA